MNLNESFSNLTGVSTKHGNKSGEQGYSLEKWRSAPEEALTPEERAFIDDYMEKLDEAAATFREHPSAAQGLLRVMVYPEIWHVLLNMSKAEKIVDKDAESKGGQMALAHEEAEAMNEEYDRRASVLSEAIKDMAEYVEKINERKTFKIGKSEFEGFSPVLLEPGLYKIGKGKHAELWRFVYTENPDIAREEGYDEPVYVMRLEKEPEVREKFRL